MSKKISNESLLDTLQKKFEKLSEDAWREIRGETESAKNYYDQSTHLFLDRDEEGFYHWPREVILPLPKEEWPEKFRELEKMYNPQMSWPGYSMYLYTMDIFCPPFIPDCLLHFGYAIHQDKLIRCPFFVVFQMREQTINGEKMMMPESFAIDPLALKSGITPDGYIGVRVKREYVEEWFLSRGRTGHPLENYVNKKRQQEHEERLYDSYIEAYHNQMAHEPRWFPQQLINFAKKEGLHIPRQERTDTRVDDEKVVEQPIQKIASSKRSKKIFLLRHADYIGGVEDPGLSEKGKEQARNLAAKIKANLNGDTENVTIWTSPACRARETAEIIKEKLACLYFVEKSNLWSDKKHRQDFNWFKNQLDNFQDEVLIVVSHLEYVQQFPEILGFSENEASYAQGVLIEDRVCNDF
ncbi:histidine phosphatase family protein [Candidatus Nomurabacteria bacterium]|nr:histidine phosphatase family protein [Candidatus Nomurabacteria bacterium]